MDNIVPVIFAILMLFITVQYGLEMSPSMYEERLLPSAGGHSPATCIVLGGCLECCSTTTRTVSVLVEDYNTSYTTIRDKVSKLSFALLLQFTNYKWEIIPYCKLNTFYLWGKMLCRTDHIQNVSSNSTENQTLPPRQEPVLHSSPGKRGPSDMQNRKRSG